MEYYLPIKKNKIMTYIATRMKPEIVRLSQVIPTERRISYDATYMWNLKSYTDELIYKAEMESQMQKTNTVTRREGETWNGTSTLLCIK